MCEIHILISPVPHSPPPGELELPEEAKVRLSTDTELEEGKTISLDKISLGAKQAVLLQFPYTG